MKIVIIEEDSKEAERLIEWIKDTKDGKVEKVFRSCLEAIKHLQNNHPPDLIFLDARLGHQLDISIFDVLDTDSHVIFTVKQADRILPLLKYANIDYLEKPICRNDLNVLLNRYFTSPLRSIHDNSTIASRISDRKNDFRTRFLIRTGMKMFSVPTNAVAYIYTYERVQYIKTMEGVIHQIDISLNELEQQLSPTDFFRVNRQYIIHYQSIKHIYNWFDGKLKLDLTPSIKDEVMVSRLRAGAFKEWLGN